MNAFLLILPVLFPLLLGASLFGLKLSERNREIYLETGVILNSILVLLLVFNRPEQGVIIFHLTGNLEFALKLDGMGSVFAALLAVLWPLATLYAFSYMKKEERENSFFAWYTMTYGVTMGVAFSGNLLTLYLFYEMLTLITVPLVMHTLTKEAIRASRRYLYYSLGGAAFAFLSVIFMTVYGQGMGFVYGGNLKSGITEGGHITLQVIYVLAFFGFGVKAAIFPVHGWLPRASVAPTPVTALLHAVAVVKSGAFAILRLTYFCFGMEFLKGTPAQYIAMAAAMITIAFGSTMAVREVHFKRRLAYSTISNLSYILLAATIMTPLGLVAALCHLVFHAFMKICAFFCAGAVMQQSERHYVYELDGLGRQMPVTFVCFTIASLSLMGMPLFAGFISKWNIAMAAVEAGTWMSFAAILVLLYSALMTGIYMMTIVARAWFPKTGTDLQALKNVKEADWMMKLPLCIFAVVILYFGLNSRGLVQLFTQIAQGLW